MKRRTSVSQSLPSCSYFSPLFGEIPFVAITPQEIIHSETHIILPCYSIPSCTSFQLWCSIFPLLSNLSNISELTRLYSFTSPASLSLLQSLPPIESSHFFRDTIPIIASLAAIHPKLFPTPLILPTTPNSILRLNRLQVASLFALSFLGLFRLPLKFQDAKQFPRCLSIVDKVSATKLRCYMAYFSTIGIAIINKDPILQEQITYQRVYGESPQWSNIPIPVSANVTIVDGLIEKENRNVLKAVFSSKAVGGNVLEDGCSQEEIMFIKCPECMVALLIAPVLNANESFRIYNVLQYSEVTGYATEISFKGNVASLQLKHDFVIFDALICVDKKLQYTQYGIDRELNKVFSAIKKTDDDCDVMQPFATGKWGCGSMLGDSRLKFIIQLLASSLTGREMRYHPLNDIQHQNEITAFLQAIKNKKPTIQELYNYTLALASTNPSSLLTRITQL
ncbi:poly(ADP-ribose) glycohydrolase [Entamoeba histolytica HM-3:IMSS]|uniref:poly(ADP-ribose) glycohydrolase n=2 Tax=Entamoeba histolytica TaxID=5759 RepID=M2RYU2_ENTHI|nr:poly(ADPribose) glycohydrolase, putative [Entamoeba histolytica KU27]EMS15211.1 poly(ADP-ribose) glycohydrolase [Entamoeba histolytica HM-3:IMSS]